MTTSDFTFAWEHADSPEGPWAHLQVVRFHGREEISTLYRYEITLLARSPAPEVDPHELIGARATLRIATLTEPGYRLLHGVLVEAEEIAAAPEGMFYRVVLMPPLVRARHRTRCRIFLEKTTRQIVEAVLLGDPHLALESGATVDEDDGGTRSFEPAAEKLCWRMADPARVDEVRIRPYCVQYNESDLAFVARLLEEEGLSYHIENGAGVCLLILSDSDQGKTRLDPEGALGGEILGRAVSSMQLGSRMREKTVRLRDYDWRKPALDLLAETDRGPGDLFEYHWPGSYADAPSQGEPLARARLDRFHVEAEYAAGEGACRVLTAGTVFRLEHAKTRYERLTVFRSASKSFRGWGPETGGEGAGIHFRHREGAEPPETGIRAGRRDELRSCLPAFPVATRRARAVPATLASLDGRVGGTASACPLGGLRRTAPA